MKKIEFNELPDAEKEMHYNVMKKYAGEKGMAQMRQMIAIEGVEITAGRIAKEYIKDAGHLPQDMADSIYNACLYAEKLQHNN